MQTELCKKLGIEFPIFAFSHCRDVVAAATNAGAFGVFGAAEVGAEGLEVELAWLDDHTHGKGYGVDLLVPSSYVGRDQGDLQASELVRSIPEEHRKFVQQLLDSHDIPPMPTGEELTPDQANLAWSVSSGREIVDIALSHEQCKLIVNALGPAPPFMIEAARAKGVMVSGLAGHPKHAIGHMEAGVDFVIAQGYEAGGHSGDIGTMVLVPAVIDAVAPLPVVAAGGIVSGEQVAAALALGAEGVWCGSVWLTTTEAAEHPAIKERMISTDVGGTTQSRANTGKPLRQMKNRWTEAWAAPSSPDPLGLPLQRLLVAEAQERVLRVVGSNPRAVELAGWPATVGQGVGLMKRQTNTKQVVMDLVEGYIESIDRLTSLS